MTVPVYIVDLFKVIVEAVANELNTHVHYEFGHPMEINSKLVELSKAASAEDAPFPIVALFTDIEENRGESGYYGDASLTLIIAMNTSRELTAEDRMETNFKPVLYPIYFNLLRQIARSKFFKETSSEKIIHSKIDRLYWGKAGIYGNEGLIFTDYLDCIEIKNLQLTVKNQICMSEFYTDIFVGNGKSAYQIWLDNGGVGTELDFLNSLIGPKGDPGDPATSFNFAGEWDAETTYAEGEVVSIQSRLGLFKSLQAANTGNTPPASTDEWWEVVMAIPGGGVVGIDPLLSENGNDILNIGGIEDKFSALWNYNYGFIKNQILAPADVWTARATNGATFQVDETATNDQVKGGFVFSGTVSQGIQLQIKNLNNELFTTAKFKVKIHSKATAVAELNSGVVWAVRGVWQGTAMDQAWSDPAILPAQNHSNINTVYSSDWSDEVRITAPETLANGSLLIEIYRAVDNAGDVNSNSAVILDVEILINQ